jgi:hypothetical protein
MSLAFAVIFPGNQLIKGLRAKGKEFCNKDWTALTAVYPDTPHEKLRSFCFSAAYQVGKKQTLQR